ncbi:MAG TPA: hypothetical protein VMD59_09425 [Acidimicrobiales bacterium]|nr:hypothetical protein [Acidimicrobiales bacterium]
MPLVLVALGIGGYFLFIPRSVPLLGRLSSLVVQQPGIAGLRSTPQSSSAVPNADSGSLTALSAAFASSPDKTGSWDIVWTKAGASLSAWQASLLVDEMPSSAGAKTLRGELDSEYVQKDTYLGEHYAETASFSVPGADARGVATIGMTYARPKSKTEAAGTTTAITMQVGRADAVVFVQTPRATRTGATKLAAAEIALLEAREPGFSLVGTQFSLLSSLVWWIVTLAVVAAAVITPKLALRARDRRLAHAAALARSQVQMRGQKVLRRRGSARRATAGRPRR